ncbi:thiosulfate/3-mercaptopyruvate sulfurtransferase [Vibrio gazogenes DSM 21264]|uniref:Thiosulfate/3-mercaptopyruvate sulfurtransferase n=2 Tax=Vibrio gazogenes TaxID=687 RepID=A0A1M5C8R4_VIBGA|nr:thiosulfate/3-mercaptopyruvate sulfurtransferase [Vibrio gazogenes DSM 21264] [Vibrio gazogenes DSM 21264 = NBRC 103151]SJN55370.1 3-mercaptopyruvate sulfurtransferase [Vibrio gazogenes]
MSPLVSPQWLSEHLSDPKLVILDSSIAFQIPAETEKDTVHNIPGARRFDYDKVFCDPDSHLPHMMPSESRFNQCARQIGLNQDSLIVVYDNSGTLASPRTWWMLKAMGHEEVYILNGGLAEWKRQGHPLATSFQKPIAPGNFSGTLSPDFFVDAAHVLEQMAQQNSLTIDARSQARFTGAVAEPRAGIRSGHIPHSICVPFTCLIDGHTLKPPEALRTILQETLPHDTEEYIFSCGSGVTACIVLLAAYICGYQNLKVYDGSWTEWGSSRHPIATD